MKRVINVLICLALVAFILSRIELYGYQGSGCSVLDYITVGSSNSYCKLYEAFSR